MAGRSRVVVKLNRYKATREQVRDGLVNAMERAVVRAEGDAKTTVPPRNRTGNLKGSIYSELTSRGENGVVVGEVGATADYAAYVEEGTNRSRAYPYLRPAAERAAAGIEAELRDELGGKR